MVINHLLNGMILQVPGYPCKTPFIARLGAHFVELFEAQFWDHTTRKSKAGVVMGKGLQGSFMPWVCTNVNATKT